VSTIAGVLHLDGRAVDGALVEEMNRRAPAPRPVRAATLVRGSAGFAVTCRGNCETSAVASSGDGSCSAVFDGIIDNREELFRELGIADAGMSDPELLLRCHEAWGADCARRIIGDFGFAIWDGRRRQLLVVRDPLGVRPLYYTRHGSTLLFATQIHQLFADGATSGEVDPEYFGDYLVSGLAVREATPYRHVQRLRPAHMLIAGGGEVHVERYWDIDPSRRIVYDSREEYVERFGELLREGIRTYLRDSGVVWSDLSGGFDSTSIVSLAQEMFRAGEARVPRFATVTVFFSEAKLSDERKWAQTVVDKYGFDAHFLDGDEHQPFMDFAEGARWWDEPHAAIVFYAVLRRYVELFTAAGVDALLTGIGAESVITDSQPLPLHLADRLRRLELRPLWRELHAWAAARGVPLSNMFLWSCLKPLLNPTRMEFVPPYSYGVAPWVKPDFAKRYDLLQRARYVWGEKRFKSPADQWQYEKIIRITSFFLRGTLDKACRIRYPFMYRPLVEFLTSIPLEAKAVPKRVKPLLLDSVIGIIPDALRTQRTHSTTGHAVYLSFVRYWPQLEELVRDPILAQLGYVDRDRLLEACKAAKYGFSPNLHMLISTLAAEVWLRSSRAAA
jgi:asparagine synthase (glutamine-hydrolysing)